MYSAQLHSAHRHGDMDRGGQLVRLEAGLLYPTETWRQRPHPSWEPRSKGWLQVLAALSFLRPASEGSSCRHSLLLPETLLEFDGPFGAKVWMRVLWLEFHCSHRPTFLPSVERVPCQGQGKRTDEGTTHTPECLLQSRGPLPSPVEGCALL